MSVYKINGQFCAKIPALKISVHDEYRLVAMHRAALLAFNRASR